MPRARRRSLAAGYLQITAFSLPLLAIGMGCSALLRSVGDARQAMDVTLIGAVVTAVLDPLLIFALHLDLDGAAISTMVSRLSLALLGLHWVARRHDMLAPLGPTHAGRRHAATADASPVPRS